MGEIIYYGKCSLQYALELNYSIVFFCLNLSCDAMEEPPQWTQIFEASKEEKQNKSAYGLETIASGEFIKTIKKQS